MANIEATLLTKINWALSYVGSEGDTLVELKLPNGTVVDVTFTVTEDGAFTHQNSPKALKKLDWVALEAELTAKYAELVKESFLDASYEACEAHDEALADGRIRSYSGRWY